MRPIDIQPAASPDAAGEVLAGSARWRVRWLAGDLIVVAVAIGRSARAADARRRADARAPGGAGGPGSAALHAVMARLARAVLWASLLRRDLQDARPDPAALAASFPHPPVRDPAWPEAPHAAPVAAPGAASRRVARVRLTLPGGAPAPGTGSAAVWKDLLRRLRAQQAREARAAMLRDYAGRPAAEVLALVGEDLTDAAAEADAPALAAQLRAILRRIAAEFGLAALPAPSRRAMPVSAPSRDAAEEAAEGSDGIRALHGFRPRSRAEEEGREPISLPEPAEG